MFRIGLRFCSCCGNLCAGQKFFHFIRGKIIGAVAELALEFYVLSIADDVLQLFFSEKDQSPFESLLAAVTEKADVLTGCDFRLESLQDAVQKMFRCILFFQDGSDRRNPADIFFQARDHFVVRKGHELNDESASSADSVLFVHEHAKSHS